MSRCFANRLVSLIVLAVAIDGKTPAKSLTKCCPEWQHIDADLKCAPNDGRNFTVHEAIEGKIQVEYDSATIVTSDEWTVEDAGTYNASELFEDLGDRCIDILPNSTLVILKTRKGDAGVKSGETCESPLTVLKFWGATIVVFANLVYIVPYFIVVFIYFAIPDLRHRAYDRAVISYNVTQIVLNSLLIGLGWSILCHWNIPSPVYTIIGLSLLYLTLVSTLWLFVICFDMTLVITRFRWAPSNDANRPEERRKFIIYSTIGWGVALVPTIIVAIIELTPWLPKSSAFKPNFARFGSGPNVAVIFYVATLPAIICAINSALFVYTTYRMIVMKKSTSIASQSSTKRAKKKYYVFLRLYLLMDSPWITAALAAIFPNLWLLKFLRIIQPILMLMAIVPRKTLLKAFERWFSCGKNREKENQGDPPQTARAITTVS